MNSAARKKILTEMIQAATRAPSPDNNQPWLFLEREDALGIYLDPSRALPSDVNGMFDLVGLGAAIENACIAARQRGFQPRVEYRAASSRDATHLPRHVANVVLAEGGQPDPLYSFLERRCTNRKLYAARTVGEETLAEFGKAIGCFPEVRLDWVAERAGVRAFARLVMRSDAYRFQYEPFHAEIYRQLRFTPEEAERTRDGLDVRTLELPPGTPAALKALRSWRNMRFLHRAGLGPLLTFPSWLSVRKSGAIGVLSVSAPEMARFVEGGRAFQRLWLTAHQEGLALHPLGSLPVFLGHLEQLQGRKLTPAHQHLAKRLGARLRGLVPAMEGRTLLMLFRVGHVAPPQVRSLRRRAEDVLYREPRGSHPLS